MVRWGLEWGALACIAGACLAGPARAEFAPVLHRPAVIGLEARRLIVGFRTTPDNAMAQFIPARIHEQSVVSIQAMTSPGDVVVLAARAHLDVARTRQVTPSMHVMYLPRTLYGAAAAAALDTLRADPAVKFADVDRRRYPHSLPNDPLFGASAGAGGQWFMLTPSSATPTSDAAATDAVSAWAITTGSSGTVIADIDTGVRFEHPDLLRAGFGGRLLPGYDFVSEDQNATTGAALGTFLIANDGDGWDPDASDPGDWISAADQANALFPAASCAVADSTWHGTRVMGLLGALTDNATGVAGMTWNPYLLPVRALGKCGGYDSDIIAGMQWAAGMPVTGAPDNPYPADIVNLSLGGSGSCPSSYADAVRTLTAMGVLIVASAGNASGPVDAPGNCAGALAVGGLRNVGTKVGYSSLGPEVGISAPAGNCVNSSGACLKSIDTTTNTGLTGPVDSAYTSETNPNLGTSFSAPIVAGVAALMRAVNANLTPAQVIERLESSASAFPQPVGLPVCPAVATDGSGECACPNDHSQCGAGMVNALAAVTAAQRPIAAVALPAKGVGGGAVLDASGSAASCGRAISAFAWTTGGSVALQSGGASPQATVVSTGAGSVTLTVTDSAGAVDVATLAVAADGSIAAAATTPARAGSAASACPAAFTVTPLAPVVSEAFAPASVSENTATTLTISLDNPNGFALTQSNLTASLPAGLTIPSASVTAKAATTCTGAAASLMVAAGTVTLSGATIAAHGSCAITIPLQSTSAGTYTNTLVPGMLSTASAGANVGAATATLTVMGPSHGGGGELDWWDSLFVIGVLLAGRRHGRRGPPRG